MQDSTIIICNDAVSVCEFVAVRSLDSADSFDMEVAAAKPQGCGLAVAQVRNAQHSYA